MKDILGKRILEFRKRAGLTQGQLADAIGSSTNTISQIELGKTWPDYQTIQAIAREFSVQDFELFQVESASAEGDQLAGIETLIGLIRKNHAILGELLNIAGVTVDDKIEPRTSRRSKA